MSQPRYKDVESWEIAKRFVALFGSVPISFTVAVRTLMKDYQRDKQYSDISKFLATRLLRGPTFSSCMARAAAAWQNEFDQEELPTERYLEIFTPYDLAALIGYLYLLKRSRKLCKSDEVGFIVNQVVKNQYACMQIGNAIPNIGLGTAVIVGGMHQMAFASFLSHDEKGFVDYRRHLQATQQIFDLDYEISRWGCTSTQVSSLLLQTFGFGLGIANAFIAAFSKSASLDNQPNRIALGMKVCWVWMDSLLKSGGVPNITHDGRYYPTQAPLERLLHAMALGFPEEDLFWFCAPPAKSKMSEEGSAPARPQRKLKKMLVTDGQEPTIDVSIEELAELTETIEEEIEG